MMTCNKNYKVTKKIKLHTKPLVEAEITNEGMFLKETENFYCFDGFRVNKETLVKVEECEAEE